MQKFCIYVGEFWVDISHLSERVETEVTGEFCKKHLMHLHRSLCENIKGTSVHIGHMRPDKKTKICDFQLCNSG